MPPKPLKNVLLMVTNVGVTSFISNSIEEEPFIDKAKYAMKNFIEKKIFLQPKDEIGIITMGDETDNPEGISNVKLYCEHLVTPNWEMVKYVNNITPTTYSSNWVEALQVALCFIRKEVVDPSMRVFLSIFNNFKEDYESIGQFDSDFIINDLKTYENLFILFIGENPQESLNSVSEKLALSIINENLAQYEQINDLIETRQFFILPPVSPAPWKCTLEWDDISIPCSTYIKVTNGIKIGPWKLHAVDNKEDLLDELIAGNQSNKPRELLKGKLLFDNHRNEIPRDDVINGYRFCGRYIPFSEEDEEAMKYSGSEKGMTIYGFVPQNEVKLEYWSGNGCRIILPDANEDPTVFYSFVKAMIEKRYAAIVRKVYAKNNLPKMGVLFPKADDDEIYCLVHLELPFVHDVHVIPKKPISSLKNIVSKEQMEALDDFIDSMTFCGKDSAYLNPGMFPDVKSQYHWNAIAHRALNPEDNNIIPINDYIKKYLEPPGDLRVKAQPKLEKLNKLFGSCLPDKKSNKEEKSIVKTISGINQKIDPAKKLNQDFSHSTDEGFMSAQDIDIGVDDLDDL